MNIFGISNSIYNVQPLKINRAAHKKTNPDTPVADCPQVVSSIAFRAKYYHKPAVNTGKDIFEKHFENEIKHRFNRMATIYLDISKSIAGELKQYGITFNEEYAKLSPIKSAKTSADKASRYGTLHLPDQIRTTFFAKNFYDLSVLFEHIIPEYAKRDFILEKEPDVEICMMGIKDLMNFIPEEYKFAACNARDSGIEQIQLRFIRAWDTDEHPIKHELIIIPGYEYAKAKHYESKHIYSNIRKFKELNFVKKGSDADPNVIEARKNCGLISNLLHVLISQKLFLNSKNADLNNILKTTNIDIQKQDIKSFDEAFKSIRRSLNEYYENARKRAKTEVRLEELDKLKAIDLSTLTEIKDNVMGNKKKGIEGSLEFFAKQKHIKDPFKKSKNN